ncbi:MAG: efflux RND transporter periplasmic adaptor subunit [Desulfovibrionaceae bacterium]|nr:efflux RND transporter periplasmic adaptor subunit [Desulfovibrionaceae bacterium]
MYKRILKKSLISRLAALGLAVLVLLPAARAWTGQSAVTRPVPAKASPHETVFQGKVFCSLTRPVVPQFGGVVASLAVRAGQKVQKGQVLARCRLEPAEVMALNQRTGDTEVRGLKIRILEIDKNISQLNDKRLEVQELASQDMAPAKSLERIDKELSALRAQKEELLASVQTLEKAARQEREILSAQLGARVSPGRAPSEAVLSAPISGHVTWLSPNMREGAFIEAMKPVLLIGVMDPMVVRGQIYENEASRLKVGDHAAVTLESVPGRVFPATVARISWSPINRDLQQPTYYEVELEAPNPDLVMKEGFKARIVFE